jgi:hypothetical protein
MTALSGQLLTSDTLTFIDIGFHYSNSECIWSSCLSVAYFHTNTVTCIAFVKKTTTHKYFWHLDQSDSELFQSMHMLPSNGDFNCLRLHVTIYYKHDKMWRSFQFDQRGWSSSNAVELCSTCALSGLGPGISYPEIFHSFSQSFQLRGRILSQLGLSTSFHIPFCFTIDKSSFYSLLQSR